MRLRPTFLFIVAAGCGSDAGSFSDQELLAIRTKLGAIPVQVPLDPSNQYADDPAAAALGMKLFFEDRYSGGTVSCATCHDPITGFQDVRANTSPGVGAGFTGRHAPTVSYVALGQSTSPFALWEFWDGRADSQWSQALGPPENPVEMGGSRTGIAYLLYDLYLAEYEAIFGSMPVMRDANGAARFPLDARPGTAAWDGMTAADQDAITTVYVGFGKAISAYERRLIPRGSRFDAFHAEIAAGAADSDLLTSEEKLGLRLFLSKGACIDCHEGPVLSDFKFHNIALPQSGPNLPAEDQGRASGIALATAGEFNCASRWSDHPDKSQCAVAALQAVPEDLGAFKTSHLRDLSRSAPYMHTGMLATLEDVIEHYDKGGELAGFAGSPDDKIAPLDLSEAEKRALVAFLRTLDGEPLPAELTTPPARPGVP